MRKGTRTASTRWSRATAAALVAALRSPSRSQHFDVDSVELVDAAAWHGVAGYAFEYLRAIDRGHPALEGLLAVCRSAARSHLWILGDLIDVQETLSAAEVPFAVVKGPAIAERLHGARLLRGYGDLDVLVHPGDFPRGVLALESAGAQVLERNWDLLARERRGQLHLRTRRDTVVDLHWHLVNDAAARASFAIPSAELLDRRVTVPVGSLCVPTTDRVDTLLHLALHTTLSGGDRLIWHKDVERAVAATEDWDEVVRRSQRWQAGLVVGTALRQARVLLHADVPREILKALAPSLAWRAISSGAMRMAPPARLAGSPSPHRMVGRSTRGDAAGSLRELSRRVVRHALAEVEDPDHRYDRTNPRSPLWPSGERGAYFAAVARETGVGGHTTA
jgi:hypothetical protein